MHASLPPALIGLDWGTSSLRAYLLGPNAHILQERSEPWGILHTPNGDFASAYRSLVEPWLRSYPGLPAIASGMIGSRQGWREVPYVETPASAATIAAALLPVQTPLGPLYLVPGVLQKGSLPNVLRGEETQILGALAEIPLSAPTSLFVLPGTHSKWVHVHEAHLFSFATHMTGELFALLREHSLLGRPAKDSGSEPHSNAFLRGVHTAKASGGEALSGRLFSTRSLFLTGDLSATHTLEYLSGLLIGEEIRSALSAHSTPPTSLTLLGDLALCSRYQSALELFGVHDIRILSNPAPRGLWQIALAAGLLPASSPCLL